MFSISALRRRKTIHCAYNLTGSFTCTDVATSDTILIAKRIATDSEKLVTNVKHMRSITRDR